MTLAIDVLVIGGGMIVNDLILPVLYHMQRTGEVGAIDVCATSNRNLKKLAENPELRRAFPGQSFGAHPGLDESEDIRQPDLYKEVLGRMPPRQAVVVATPDQYHFGMVVEALEHDQHVLCVKPLVLEHRQATTIAKKAYERGLFVGVEYHKRFDRRSLVAKKRYGQGDLGEFVVGEAKLIEPYYYRHSNFQNWFTTENTDPFVYVGCHYVDLVQFITGLRPAEVSVHGVRGRFPNGNEGYLWSVGVVRFENGALLSVTNGLGYPDDGAGSNEQCLSMYFEGGGVGKTGHLKHNDQFRGVEYSFLEGIGPGGSHFNYINPDFFRLVPWDGPGYKPVGYGPDSVTANLAAIRGIERSTRDVASGDALERRREILREIDGAGIIATPSNSSDNELVMEAARLSILNDGARVKIVRGDPPRVELAW
ncbi:MAG: Gfo/Idh/MocA family protein [Promethearchaeota archaeon]